MCTCVKESVSSDYWKLFNRGGRLSIIAENMAERRIDLRVLNGNFQRRRFANVRCEWLVPRGNISCNSHKLLNRSLQIDVRDAIFSHAQIHKCIIGKLIVPFLKITNELINENQKFNNAKYSIFYSKIIILIQFKFTSNRKRYLKFCEKNLIENEIRAARISSFTDKLNLTPHLTCIRRLVRVGKQKITFFFLFYVYAEVGRLH